ncbi:MAG TPA: heparan-alpha-glucosaminide N-acetyltransferase, partial [Alphaproteobacteria bacterium]|nr:heparan-alpha-glucosaminide N-acetyltransferase [Alphaproteobacteria bacterium]
PGAGAPGGGGVTARIDAPAAASAARLPVVDAARGAAILAMFVYHFAWDLSFYDLISVDISREPAWQAFARAIAGSFLALVGVSLVLAQRGGIRLKPFLRRLAMVGGAALAITIATRIAVPDDFIYFGILHAIAVSSVLGLLFLRLPIWLVAIAAAACLAAPAYLAHPTFNAPVWRWLGLMTYFPRTNDYVPLLPWFGMVLAGVAAARLVLAHAPGAGWLGWRPNGPAGRATIWAGRHSLALYLVHQPVFLAVLYGVSSVTGPSPAAETARFMGSCEATCASTGTEAAQCTAYCACVADALKAEDLWRSVLENRVTPAEQAALTAITGRCEAE